MALSCATASGAWETEAPPKATMIVFGSAITDSEVYERCAEPGLRLVAEPDSEIIPQPSAGSIFRNYNLIMDQAAGREGLEALVLVHQDAEIIDPDFCATTRAALSDPDVALVGAAGAVGVRSIGWWTGSVTWASFTHRYEEFGGGEIPALSWDMTEMPSYAHTGEVDSIDGFVMVLSPWAIEQLRFDESLGMFHGYDFDMCLQVKAAGKKVVSENLRVVHHHSLDLIGDTNGWIEAHIRVAEKWDGAIPQPAGADWRRRALRAEAEADAAKMLGLEADQIRQAQAAQDLRRIQGLEWELGLIKRGSSWRLTAPVRWLGRIARRVRDRLRGSRREPA